tara:strand:+ start:282 stop:566 length:285 start_codon:yes stop_codon:yes gene_type:complete
MFAPFTGTSATSNDIADHLHAAMNAQSIDGDWEKKYEDRIVRQYRHSSEETRDMVNQCFAALCGWSFATLAKNAGYKVTPYKKQKVDWQIQRWE